MFEKLLSLVPYNPGMIHQLAFYGRRMHEEASIRRMGMVFMVLAFVVQSVAVLNPPASAVTGSNNDLLNGGFNSAADASKRCKANEDGYMMILHSYNISCDVFDNVTQADVVYIHSNEANNYFSAGHNPTGVARESGEIHIDGARSIYFRPLNTWGNPSGGWKTLRVYDQDHKNRFYIMYDCGNLVSPGGVPSKRPFQTATATVVSETSNVPGTPAPSPTPHTTPAPVPTDTTTTVPSTAVAHPVNPCKFNPNIDANDSNCPYECPSNTAIPITSEQCFFPCPYNGTIDVDNAACKPCDKSTSIDDAVACISVHKTASNITQNIADANNTTAKAGDIITYTLYAQNTGKETVSDFTFQESLADILDYADVADPHGGTVARDGVIAWPSRDLDPGESTSVQVTVKVKNPIPQTPVSSSDPAHFDMLMTNVYGNAVNIKLPAAPAKSVELAATKLPNTGPGTTLLIAASLVVVGGYFYSRASLLARETGLAIKEQANV